MCVWDGGMEGTKGSKSVESVSHSVMSDSATPQTEEPGGLKFLL